MVLTKFKRKAKSLSIFLWLVLLIIIISFVTSLYEKNKALQYESLKKTLNNIYFQKTLTKITSELKERYLEIEYFVKEGDSYESIISDIKISKSERKKFLEAIKKSKNVKILRPRQKIYFKIDNKDRPKISEFIIELSKKKEIHFIREFNKKNFKSKIIEKDLKKIIVYKEGRITNSLYQTAGSLGIKPNLIIEFARLYGFQVDFQRDIWKDDSFQIIYEEFLNEIGETVETGNIIFSNLNLKNQDLKLYRHEYEKNKIDYFDENGKSMRKTLMKTPINGARLSSSFGKRKHPILGFTKMHTGTDFAAPTGTPILASGDGQVVRAQWCGGGGNCVKIKHNRTYQTVYAHMSKFGKGIKKGARVKQGQIIGYVGSTGLSTGPHLHYEVIENGRKINSQKLKLPSGKILKGDQRKVFEIIKIKIDVLKSNLISKI
ncbi:M23 family metallopeptidase [Pelagibacterales bacterium SAG-MED23]|nr:M23 family metallopeptidase [Pelagibacterales bacterium SAG-MED23]